MFVCFDGGVRGVMEQADQVGVGRSRLAVAYVRRPGLALLAC